MLTSSIKRKVMRGFDRSAKGYRFHALFQEEIARETAAIAMRHAKPEGRILDIGCGDGALLAAIIDHQTLNGGSATGRLAVDVSTGMCAVARGRLGPMGAAVIRADAESLPLATSSVTMIVSSLALQWVEDIDAALMEAARTLAPGGAFVAATLGPGTFPELRQSARKALGADNAGHDTASAFPSVAEMERSLAYAGFDYTISRSLRARYYENFLDFIRSLKNVGAMGQPGLTGAGLARRGFLQSLEREYENEFRFDEGLRATYETLFITAVLKG